MRAVAVHTCPLREYPDGSLRPGMEYDPTPTPVVGVVIAGAMYRLLLTMDER